MSFEVKKKFSARSDRVKSVDLHPTEPWVMAALYNGNVFIYNYQTQNIVRQFEVTDVPVRTAKFVARKQWAIIGSDDMAIRVYNYNTGELVHKWEAHTDYIRSIAVHPSLPYLLTTSDDMSIKLWDWDQGWSNIRTFEGHTHYVMMVAFNPKDPNTFATASLDRKIKVWGLGASQAHFTLEGHEKGVNYVDYFAGGEKPYLISAADDHLVKVWDYQTKTCVATLEGHTQNVSAACFHPELPVIISGSEDGSVKIWNAKTYRLEKSLNYGWERIWALAYRKDSNLLGVGCDEGLLLLKLGRDIPVASMDQTGKIIFAKHNEVFMCNVSTALEGTSSISDGEVLQLQPKELGRIEIHPQILKHNPNGRSVAVCGDGEYTIYTALKWRNQAYGNALDFVWGNYKSSYAVRENSSRIKIFDDFKETQILKPDFNAETIYGGQLLGVASKDFVCLYDWQNCRLIRKIDVTAKALFWSESGDQLVITTDSAFYVLKYNKDKVTRILEQGTIPIPDDGIEDSFDVIHEIPERVRTGCWIGECFIYTTSSNRLNYCVGAKTETISHLDRRLYLLGYLPKYSRVFLIDKALNVVSYTLHLAVIEYETAVLRGDLTTAEKILPRIPQQERPRIAQFLDTQGLKELALQISTDPDHRFDLAIQLGKLDLAFEIAKDAESPQKWKLISDLAIQSFNVDLAEKCLWNAEDLSGLLLLYSSLGNVDGFHKLAEKAREKNKHNIAFVALFLLGRVNDCIDLLVSIGRIPEAALLARSYAPSRVSELVEKWKADLRARGNIRQAESLADPTQYENLFPDLQWAKKVEEMIKNNAFTSLPATAYSKVKNDLERDLIQEIKEKERVSISTEK